LWLTLYLFIFIHIFCMQLHRPKIFVSIREIPSATFLQKLNFKNHYTTEFIRRIFSWMKNFRASCILPWYSKELLSSVFQRWAISWRPQNFVMISKRKQLWLDNTGHGLIWTGNRKTLSAIWHKGRSCSEDSVENQWNTIDLSPEIFY
jgi:hypothetical protein